MTPEGWSELAVLDACEKIGRVPTVPRSQYRERGKLPVVDQGQAMIAGFTDDDEARYPGPLPVVVFGDHTREWKFIDFPFAVGADGTQLLRARREHDQRFLFHALKALPLKSLGYSRHFKLLRELSLLVPPLAEQRKIAAILSSVDDAIGATQAVIDQLQVVKKAMMAELLTRGLPGRHTRFKWSEIGEVPEGWDVRPLEAWLARLIDYRGKSPPKHDQGTRLITAKNVRAGYIDRDPEEYIREGSYDEWMSRGIPEPGDVLFTTEAPLGNAAVVPAERIALGQRLVTLCPDRTRVDPSFLLWTVLSPGFQVRLESKATGSTVKGIKQSVLRTFPLAMPCLAEQRRIGETMDAIASLLSTLKTELAAIRFLKTTLLAVLLTAEVRVKPDDEAA